MISRVRTARVAVATLLSLSGLAMQTAVVPSPSAVEAQAALPTSECGLTLIHKGIPQLTPVVFVHGMDSGPQIWNGLAKLVTDHGPNINMWTFDYSAASLNWVTDQRIGPSLGRAIGCLAHLYNTSVIVIAHSMGGLATQYAASMADQYGGQVGNHIATVITLGTPFRGSAVLTMMQAGIDGTKIGLRAGGILGKALSLGLEEWLSRCAGTTVGNDANASCNESGLNFAIFRSPVGTSLQYDSSDIKALPHWPTYLPVVAMAGTISVTESLASQSYTVQLGDGVVSEDSAMADDTAPQTSTTTVPGSPFAQTHYWPAIREVHCVATMKEVHASGCFHTNLIDNPAIDTEILNSLDHWEAG